MILRSPFPALQGIQALALVVPLFLLLFADVYYVLAQDRPGSFGTELTRTDALYFTVTMFTTVGFGDIAPVSATARILVMIQMVANLLVLSIALRVIVTAVRHRRSSTVDLSRGQQQRGDQADHPGRGHRRECPGEAVPGRPGQHGARERRPHRRTQVGHTARDPRDVALGRVRAARLDQVHRRRQHDPDPGTEQEQPRNGARRP
ncbi:potassium channel family protein [Amycolatopsis japonica]|uniref:potassium channel family protein n=1 Tax=Amycolatopsis japonica TaxID=208439 RepID=UPI00366FC59D